MAHLYFTESPIDASTTSVELRGDEAHHAAQVARLREGESIEISDGQGWRAAGTARLVSKSVVEVSVSNPVFEEPRQQTMTLVQALAKGDRDEMAVQASTELGVARVIPWQAERSISRWDGDKRAKGVARWQSIAREAAKQSVRSRIPVVADPVSTAQIVAACDGATVLVLDPRAPVGIGEWARANLSATGIALVVGPEGGISDAEVSILTAAGATAVHVGTDIMRTSTAGPAAIAALRALLGEW
ncbi:MAG: 16S rRNA (uracil(1498)-N(3))-methyltransferase [Microbacteriaceae bacterium]